jgi:DNA polymerase V
MSDSLLSGAGLRSEDFLLCHISEALPVSYFDLTVSAGFPSPAGDSEDLRLDLNDLLIRHPEATFFVRVWGDSMIQAGIHCGDILVVDRSLDPYDGAIVVAILNGEFTVKRIRFLGTTLKLVPENPAYPEILISADHDFQVWGVVSGVVRKFTPTGRSRP